MEIIIDDGCYTPTKGHAADAGVDLRTPIEVIIPSGGSASINTGVHINIPKGYYCKLESKSGLNVNHGIVSLGGVIDSGYDGSIVVKLYNFGESDYTFHPGDKIVQMIVHKHYTDDIVNITVQDNAKRGDNGFGSTRR